MAKTLAQRISQLEKIVTDYFTGGAAKPSRRARKSSVPRRKAKKSRKTTRRKTPRKAARA
jgi:hypothetical protein